MEALTSPKITALELFPALSFWSTKSWTLPSGAPEKSSVARNAPSEQVAKALAAPCRETVAPSSLQVPMTLTERTLAALIRKPLAGDVTETSGPPVLFTRVTEACLAGLPAALVRST